MGPENGPQSNRLKMSFKPGIERLIDAHNKLNRSSWQFFRDFNPVTWPVRIVVKGQAVLTGGTIAFGLFDADD